MPRAGPDMHNIIFYILHIFGQMLQLPRSFQLTSVTELYNWLMSVFSFNTSLFVIQMFHQNIHFLVN